MDDKCCLVATYRLFSDWAEMELEQIVDHVGGHA
jgi:hypothetical protein